MSYCRIGPDSDVYLYKSGDNEWNCCICPVHMFERYTSINEILKHLLELKKAGHKVPDYAIERLEQETF